MEDAKKVKNNYIYSIDTKDMFILVLGLAVVTLAPIFIFNFEIIRTAGSEPIFLLALISWFIVHELVHGISYRLSKGVTKHDVAFGAKLEKVVFFCVCKKKISKKDTIRSLLTPLFVLGFATLVIGFIFNLELLIILSCANICGSAGDILMSLFIRKMPNDLEFIEDNDNNFVIITSEDIPQKKSFGVKFKKREEDFEKIAPIVSRKVLISKWSYVIFGSLCVYTVLSFIGIV